MAAGLVKDPAGDQFAFPPGIRGNDNVRYILAEELGLDIVILDVYKRQHLDGVLSYYKTIDKMGQAGEETTVLAENTVNKLDARKALAMLKLKMRKKEQR